MKATRIRNSPLQAPLLCVGLALLGCPSSAQGVPPLGSNLHAVEDWNPAQPFVDLARTLRQRWISGNRDGRWDDGRLVEVGTNGWPARLASDQIARNILLGASEG